VVQDWRITVAPEPRTSSARRGTGERITILIASDDPFSRQAFRSALARARDLTVVGADSVATVAAELAGKLQPDVVVVDVQIRAVDALLAVQQVAAHAPRARIIAFASPASDELGLLCLTAGATGYLTKEVDFAALPRILRSVGHGEAAVSRFFTARLIQRMRATAAKRAAAAAGRSLTAPERQVLELICSGLSAEGTASQLGVNIATVERHFASARRKVIARATPDQSGALTAESGTAVSAMTGGTP
jgi:DNA-binding NarL/FixJ family response regulator